MENKNRIAVKMKWYLVMTLLLSFITVFSQDFSTRLIFENDAGTDSVLVGYDASATEGLDTVFGEAEIQDLQFGEDLDVRLANLNLWYIDCFPNSSGKSYNEILNYHTKVEILSSHCAGDQGPHPVTTLLIPNHQLPITMTWARDDFDVDCVEYSFITDVHPGFWFDGGCFQVPFETTYFKDENSLQIPFPGNHMLVDTFGDTLSVFFLTISEQLVSSTKEAPETSLKVWPNPFDKTVNVEINGLDQKFIKMYSIDGRLLIETSANSVDTQNLLSGTYVLTVQTGRLREMRKIIKR